LPSTKGTSATIASAVKGVSVARSPPSGATTALVPTVEMLTSARPVSTARSRAIASC
jgi:hypothetical protein